MKELPLPGVLSLVVGIIILLFPQLLNYALGIFLIVNGIIALNAKKK